MRGTRGLARLGVLALAACSGRDGEDDDDQDLVAGSTAIVALLNPVPNDGNATAVPSERGDEREGVEVEASPGGADVTDVDGVAVVETEPGAVELAVGGEVLALEVVAEGDVVDVAIAWDGDAPAIYDGTPVRYAAGERSGARFVEPGTEMAEIEGLLEQDDVVVVLGPGTYPGDLEIRGSWVVLFGQGFSRDAVVVDGAVDVRGERVRIRGLTITGALTANGNDFGASFATVLGPASITGNGGAFLANRFCDGAVVPSSSATLLDNAGVAPLDPPEPAHCAAP